MIENMRVSRLLTVSLFAAVVCVAACNKAPEQAVSSAVKTPANPNVVRLDPAFDQLVSANATVDKVATGFQFLEGPLWRTSGHLWFSDLVGNILYETTPDGKVMPLLNPGGDDRKDPPKGGYIGPNGMAVGANGNVVLCQHGNRRIVEVSPEMKVKLLIERSADGKHLNSPNDVVYTPDGSLYFTDPPFGLAKGNDDPAKEEPYNGVYRFKDGKAIAIIKDVALPNGIAFSPDFKVLYISNSDDKQRLWMRYDVNADGTVAHGRVFADASSSKDMGVPDGMRVDSAGNVYATGPGGIWVFSSAGKQLGTIKTPEQPSNLAFGDADAKTIYITATSSVYKIRVNIAGEKPAFN
jgi:gluconolactonase